MIISADIAVQTLQCNYAHCKQWVQFFSNKTQLAFHKSI